MALDQNMRLQTATSLVMTPQLQQAIKLLQLSHQELESFLTEQLADNPLLVLETQPASTFLSPASSQTKDYGCRDKNSASSDSNQQDWLETSIPAAPISLREHVLNQINSEILDPIKRLIARHLVNYLQPTGYFEGDVDEIAKQLGVSKKEVTDSLHVLQKMDPAGVFAQTLKDCLKAQLEDQEKHTPAFEKLLDHLELLGKGDLAALQRKCKLGEAELSEMILIIRSLHPKPGLVFEHFSSSSVIPEIVMLQDERTGEWAVDLNPEVMPKLLLDVPYYTKVRETLKEKEEKKYLAERFSHANWLIKALHQRATTMIRVSQEIIRKQEDFFTYGISYLKPLVLRDIADHTGLHESTVSRVTNNKYISTPRGVFELKYFFNASLEGASGINYASVTIRHRIQALVNHENPLSPLSDDGIALKLKEEGMNVARRTVAKYRDILKIPPAFQRKRMQGLRSISS